MSIEKNNYVASVRIRMIDIVNIAKFLDAQGNLPDTKGKIISAGIRYLSDHLPENMKCNTNREAIEYLQRFGIADGRGKENRLSKIFNSQIEKELTAEKYITNNLEIIKNMDMSKFYGGIEPGEKPKYVPEDFCASDKDKHKEYKVESQTNEKKSSESIKSVVTAHEGYEADIPGNKTDFKKEMLSGINSIKPYDERENDE